MALEEKAFAYWIDLGTTSFQETEALQRRLAELRKANRIPDVILCTEHTPHISFGSAKDYNRFDPTFLEEVKRTKGALTTEAILAALSEKGIEFHETSRGGGSTFIGPGQLVFYPIVDYERITKRPLGVGEYKLLLDQIMIQLLTELYAINDVRSVEVAQALADTNPERKDRRDIWVVKDGRNLKIGAKGIHTSGNIAYHGFSIFVTEQGIAGFDHILACGYRKDQLGITCMERELDDEVDLDVVKRGIKDIIEQKFDYESGIVEATLDQIIPEEVEA